MTSTDPCTMDATDLAAAILAKTLSSREILAASLERIARSNPAVNALVTLVARDELETQALAADAATMRGESRGLLHGLPIGVKDGFETRGIRTTFGSPIFRDHVPLHDHPLVEREKAAGAIVIGKTNVPEFLLGSNTFNRVFGATRNPYDLTKTSGGSTGGGCAALACGMVPLADGSDFGGSLRNPANFCNVVGLRPSPGRVPTDAGYSTLPVSGPVGRSVRDVALLLSVQARFTRDSPLAIDGPAVGYHRQLERNFGGTRVALFTGLGLPWESEVYAAIRAQRDVLESIGCSVDDAEPDFTDADEIFVNLRHALIEAAFGSDSLVDNVEDVNDYVRWHVEEGRKLSGSRLTRLEQRRSALFARIQRFMETYEFFVLPVSQVLPFDVSIPYPTAIAGVTMTSYIDWMKSAWYVSTVGNPALSVPVAFSAAGLPIGMQIVGRHHDDLGVLQLGHAVESATRIGRRRPLI